MPRRGNLGSFRVRLSEQIRRVRILLQVHREYDLRLEDLIEQLREERDEISSELDDILERLDYVSE